LDERLAANHLALIRSFLIDSDVPHALCEAFCANFFRTAFALHKVAIDAKFTAPARKNFSSAAFSGNHRRHKKPL